MKKALAVLLALCFYLTVLPCFAAGAPLTVSNPYADVDWTAATLYKAALHSHTNASDGSQTLAQSVARHLACGFDIVAITDHGTVDRGWDTDNTNIVKTLLDALDRSEGGVELLSSAGTLPDGTAYTYTTAENGDDYLTADDGRTILRVPYGIENNALSVNAHVNSWFVDYADNSVTIYEDAVRGVDKAGGVCVINHPGEYTKARYELHTADAYDEGNPAYAYYINKYAHLIDAYDACIGIDINSKGDNRTRFERKLWDILLTRFSADGRSVLAIASSDAHQLSVIDTGFTLFPLTSLTSDALRQALTKGESFPASHCIGNYDELVEIAGALREFYGETPLYESVKAAADAMAARVGAIENGELPADEDIGITWSVLDGEGRTDLPMPAVTGISVDNDAHTIRIDSENALIVRFISGGKLIDTVKASDGVIDLDDYAGKLGNYVRAEIFGEGGIVYTQAFLLNAAANAGRGGSMTEGVYVNLGFFDFLLSVFNNWREIVVRFFAALPKN